MPSRDAAGQQSRRLAASRVRRGGRQGPARLGVGAGVRWTALPPERGWEDFLCDEGGGRPPGAGNGEHKAEGLETTLDVDQRRLENSATRLRPRSRGSTLLRPLIRGLPPACSLLPGSAYKGARVPWVPLGARGFHPPARPWSLALRGGWGLGTRSQPDGPLRPAFLYSSEAGKGAPG